MSAADVAAAIEAEKKRIREQLLAKRKATAAADASKRVTAAQAAMGTASGDVPGDESAVSAAQDNLRTAASPGEEERVPVVNTREELDRVASRTGGVVRPVMGAMQVQDPSTGRSIAQLHGGANIRMSDWWDAPRSEKALLGLTGQFNPASSAIGAGISALRGQEQDSSRGVREHFMDAAEAAGRNPNTRHAVAALAAASAAPAVTGNLIGAGWNKAQEMLDRASSMGEPPEVRDALLKRAEENQQEGKAWARDALRAAGEVRAGADVLGDISPEEGARRGREVLGVRGADVASLFNPTDVPSLALKGAGIGVKAVAKKAAPAVGRAMEALATTNAPDRPGLFSNMPAKVGAPESQRAVMEAAQSTFREYPNLEFQRVTEALAGYTPQQRKAALNVFHDLELRKAAEAADPKVGELLDKLQVENLKAAVKAGVPLSKYNPLHVYVGQDFVKAAREGVSASAIDDPVLQSEAMRIFKRAGGDEAAVDFGAGRVAQHPVQRIEPDINAPGIRALYNDEQLRKLLTAEGRPAAGRAVSPATPSALDLVRRQMAGENIPEEEIDFVIKQYAKENPGALQKLVQDVVSAAPQEPTFLPGIRKADSAQQRAFNTVAAEVRARAGAQSPVPQYARKAVGLAKDDSDIEHIARSMLEQDAVSGMAGSARAAASHSPRRIGLALQEMLESPEAIQAAKAENGPLAYTPATDFLARFNEQGKAFAQTLNHLGDDLGSKTLHPEVTRELAKDDLVILMPARGSLDIAAGGRVMPRGGYNEGLRVVAMPGVQQAVVVPRRYAMAALQLRNGPTGGGESFIRGLDSFLGSAMANASVTQGNPGFQARNLLANSVRGGIDMPGFFDASERAATAAELRNPETVQEAMRLLGVGKNIGASMDQFNVAPRAPAFLPSGARRAVERVHGALMAPGKAVNESFDYLAGRGAFGDLPLNWGADDAIRAHHWLMQVRKGTSPRVAALNTNRLFINYADKSQFERVVKPFAPFVRFYTGVQQGAVALALRQPQRFSRIWALANYIRNQDTQEGKTTNAKARSYRDIIAGVPTIQDPTGAGGAMALRYETPMTESLALVDAVGNMLSPNFSGNDRRGGSLLGPAITGPLALVAPDMAESMTGFRPLNVGPEEWARTSGTLPGRAYDVARDISADPYLAQSVADSPYASLAWDLVRKTGYMMPTGWADPLVRYGTGATGYEARTPERADSALWRAMVRMGPGLRTEPIDVGYAMGKKSAKIPKTASQMKQGALR